MANASKQIIEQIGSLVFNMRVRSFVQFLIGINLVIRHRKQILVHTVINSERTSFDVSSIYQHQEEW